MALGALTDGYNGGRGVSGVLGALAQDAEAVLEIATAGVAGAAGKAAKSVGEAVTPVVEGADAAGVGVTKSSRKRIKSLIRNLSNNSRQENGLSQEKTDQLRGIVEKAGGTIRNDGSAGVRGSSAGQPHVQTEGLGKSTDSRHVWTQDGVE